MPIDGMRSAEILGVRMAYVDTGATARDAPVVVLQHGNPTSSYLWRDVIPAIAPHARCIAADLIGFGQSDKPDIAYRVEDHVRFFEAFIETLGLDQVVFVLHDWGSALGLDWARRHSDRVRGLALMEFIWPMPTWLDLSPAGAVAFKRFRDPAQGRSLLVDRNCFVEEILPGGVVGGLSEETMANYRQPFLDPGSREPVFRFPNELPIAGAPADVWAMASAYHAWLLETETPKLFFHVAPGGLISPARARWYSTHLRRCRSVALGEGRHFLQENHGPAIGREIAAWLPTI